MANEMDLLSAPTDVFLAAAGWQPGAVEDLTRRETLPFDYVASVFRAARAVPIPVNGDLPADPAQRAAILALGLVCLSLGVAQWGLAGAPSDLSDPNGDGWKGAPTGRGKHLVSVRDGGIGLPHFDVGDLSELLGFALRLKPEIGDADIRVRVENLARRFNTGLKYKHLNPREEGTAAEATEWNTFVRFCEEALGRKEVQHWALAKWITNYWLPSLKRVITAGGTITETFINARIRNSSPRNAACALEHARGKINRINAELEAYADQAICPDAKERHRTRFGYMLRPVTVWNL